MSNTTSWSPFVKGYLIVRLNLAKNDDSDEFEETFFFVKEHRGGNSVEKDKKNKNNTTLFVANAPVVPGVRPRILLKSILGRYGEIRRVTLVANAGQQASAEETKIIMNQRHPTFLKTTDPTEKFAHVVFSSNKAMRRALRSLTEIMSESIVEGVTLDKLEIQMLRDEDERCQEIEKQDEDDSEKEQDEHINNTSKLQGILAVAERYHKNCFAISRSDLMDQCNATMELYENAEQEQQMAKEAAAAGEPDDDGFITVTHSTAVGTKRDLDNNKAGQSQISRRKKTMRSRKKKEINGASELTDFYRFQHKETRKRTLVDLRRQFQEDLAKVKRMKEEKQYKPF